VRGGGGLQLVSSEEVLSSAAAAWRSQIHFLAKVAWQVQHPAVLPMVNQMQVAIRQCKGDSMAVEL